MEESLLDYGTSFYTQDNKLLNIELQKYNIEAKVFCIFFMSSFHPFSDEIYTKINSLSNQEKEIQIVFCPCDETEEEYKISKLKITNKNVLTIPFSEKERIEKIINKHNVNYLPYMVIVNKEGKEIFNLLKEEIMKIKKEDILGWINQSNLNKLFSDLKYQIGEKGYSPCHPHTLTYAISTTKMPEYRSGNWCCDECGKSFKPNVTNFYCSLCGYDICDICYDKTQ